MPLERELKFSLLEAFPSPEELAPVFAAAGYNLSDAETVEQRDRYYDDAARTLNGYGLALRKRKVSGRTLATLKRPGSVSGALHERDEIEVPFNGEDWPSAVFRPVSTLVDPAALRSQVDLTTVRTNYRVARGGKNLATLSFDAVSAEYPGGAQSVHFSEAEIEALGDTSADELQKIAEIVDTVVRLTPNAGDKLTRAEALLSLGASFQDG